jgi:hypothetical protein
MEYYVGCRRVVAVVSNSTAFHLSCSWLIV